MWSAREEDAIGVVRLLQQKLSNTQYLFNGEPKGKLSHEGYIDYYKRQWSGFAPYAGRQFAATSSPQDIAHLIQNILNANTYEKLMEMMESTNTEKEARERSIDLAARLIVMVSLGGVKNQVSPRRSPRWEGGLLGDFIRGLFNSNITLSCKQTRLPKSFDAWSISNVAGIEIVFTDNLVDHLRLVEDDTRLLIFHHASFLEYHRSSTLFFPDGLVEETLRTLALLFPQGQFSYQHGSRGSRRKWLRKLRLKYCNVEETVIDPRLANCGTPQGEDRQIERFH
ncbi:hypothetical protein VTH82DRAFT_7776 [Thermothelomyces myriococcoides]